MKLIILFTAGSLFALPPLARGQANGITCTLSADKASYKAGEVPRFTVRIRNERDSTIQFVKVLDGSDMQWRYPYSYYEVGKLAGRKSAKPKQVLIICGNMDGISATDFVATAPGQQFNPYQDQSAVYTAAAMPSASDFSKRGRYRVVYHYATNEPDFRKWMGDMATEWFDWQTGLISPSKKERYEQLETLFAKVPKLNLVSNELLLKFK
jgi:hypothetical protein